MKRIGALSCIVFTLLCLTGCNKETDRPLVRPLDSYTIEYDEGTVVDDNLLREQPYIMPEDYDTRCVAVFRVGPKSMEMVQYLVKNGDELNVDVAMGEQLIISQYANKTVLYTWLIKNKNPLNYLELENRTWMDVPLPKSDWGKAGASLDRQNFYFKPVKEGRETLLMRYEHQEEERTEFFDVTIRVGVVESQEQPK